MYIYECIYYRLFYEGPIQVVCRSINIDIDMYICTYICMYVCMYVYTCVYMYVYIKTFYIIFTSRARPTGM